MWTGIAIVIGIVIVGFFIDQLVDPIYRSDEHNDDYFDL